MPRLIPSRRGTDPRRDSRDPRERQGDPGGRERQDDPDRQYASHREYASDGQGDPRGRDHPDDCRERGRPGTGFGVPAFAHPLVAPAAWAELARPGAPLHWAAFDVARGPGARPDPLYAEVGARVRENGVPLLGLLDAAHGTRPFGDLVSDASRYLDWYRVDGFYLDRAPTARADAGECHRVTSILRALLEQEGRRGHLVLAPGTHPDPGYADLADQLVTFAGPWERYRWSEAPQWTAAHPPSRFVHLVHGLPAPHLEGALRIARWQGAATVWLTDRTDRDGADPWAGLPGYWHQVVRTAGGRPTARTPPTM